MQSSWVAGHRAWDPPDPIPNSEVKPRSVSGVSVVFGHVKPGKLAIPLASGKFFRNHVISSKARVFFVMQMIFKISTPLFPTERTKGIMPLQNISFLRSAINSVERYTGNPQNLLPTLRSLGCVNAEDV
jgi:hypothetical protein